MRSILTALALGAALNSAMPALAQNSQDARLTRFWSEEATTVPYGRAKDGKAATLTLPPVLMPNGHRGSMIDFGTNNPFYWEIDCSSGRAKITNDPSPAPWIFFPPDSIGRQAVEVVCASQMVFDLQSMHTVSLKQQ